MSLFQIRYDLPAESLVQNVIPLSEHIRATFAVAPTVFHTPRRYRVYVRTGLMWLCTFVERYLHLRLYVLDELRELRLLSPELRQTLLRLTKDKRIKRWEADWHAAGMPELHKFKLEPMENIAPNGYVMTSTGALGDGAGATLEQAGTIAVAEFIERIAYDEWWNNATAVSSTYADLYTRASVTDLTLWQFLQPDQRKTEEIPTTDSVLSWVQATVLETNKRIYVPAACVYGHFRFTTEEPYLFLETNSSGVAAYTNYQAACTLATLELLERDAIMLWWYHKRVCPQLDAHTLPDEGGVWRRFYAKATEVGFCVKILNITTDVGVPTLLVVVYHPQKPGRIHVSAASAVRFETALVKIIREVGRIAHGWGHRTTSEYDLDLDDPELLANETTSFDRRRKLWSVKKIQQVIEPLLTGPIQSFETIKSSVAPCAIDEYSWVQERCRISNKQVFLADLSSTFTLSYGLHVVRALSPDLVPVFFNERLQYRGLRRLTHDLQGRPVQLNPFPHPFL